MEDVKNRLNSTVEIKERSGIIKTIEFRSVYVWKESNDPWGACHCFVYSKNGFAWAGCCDFMNSYFDCKKKDIPPLFPILVFSMGRGTEGSRGEDVDVVEEQKKYEENLLEYFKSIF